MEKTRWVAWVTYCRVPWFYECSHHSKTKHLILRHPVLWTAGVDSGHPVCAVFQESAAHMNKCAVFPPSRKTKNNTFKATVALLIHEGTKLDPTPFIYVWQCSLAISKRSWLIKLSNYWMYYHGIWPYWLWWWPDFSLRDTTRSNSSLIRWNISTSAKPAGLAQYLRKKIPLASDWFQCWHANNARCWTWLLLSAP